MPTIAIISQIVTFKVHFFKTKLIVILPKNPFQWKNKISDLG